jgi:hypothetical protein
MKAYDSYRTLVNNDNNYRNNKNMYNLVTFNVQIC